MRQDTEWRERFALNRLSPEEAETVRKLTPAQLEAAYRIQEFEYRAEDAENHAETLYPGLFDEEDYREMAASYLNQQDCNMAENDLWNMVVEDAAALKKEENRAGDRAAGESRGREENRRSPRMG